MASSSVLPRGPFFLRNSDKPSCDTLGLERRTPGVAALQMFLDVVGCRIVNADFGTRSPIFALAVQFGVVEVAIFMVIHELVPIRGDPVDLDFVAEHPGAKGCAVGLGEGNHLVDGFGLNMADVGPQRDQHP